jgi:hypothetical protein
MLTLKLSMTEVQVIYGALSKRPYEEVAQLIANVSQQVEAQQKAETAASSGQKKSKA